MKDKIIDASFDEMPPQRNKREENKRKLINTQYTADASVNSSQALDNLLDEEMDNDR